eukprot:4470820-Pleurochrysis_carterae.AAC.1
MASAMARSTTRVKPSRWKYFLPGSVMPLSFVISSCSRLISALNSSISAAIGSTSKTCDSSAQSGSPRSLPGAPCSGNAGPPALAAPWPPSGCGLRAPRSDDDRPAPAIRGAPSRPACA